MQQRAPRIIPIKELRNTASISEQCHNSDEPIYITKNGYADLVIMSIENYEKKMYLAEVYSQISKAEQDVKEGKTTDALEHIKKLRLKYGL